MEHESAMAPVVASTSARVTTWHSGLKATRFEDRDPDELLVRVTELTCGRLLVEVELVTRRMGSRNGQEPLPGEVVDSRNWIL